MIGAFFLVEFLGRRKKNMIKYQYDNVINKYTFYNVEN